MLFEQNVNRQVDERRIQPLQNTQNVEYAPESAKWFDVRSFWVNTNDVKAFEAGFSYKKIFFRLERGQKQILFLVHPESESFYQDFLKSTEKGPLFKALSTSSSRTVLMHPEGQPDMLFFAKLSLNKEVGGSIRTIPSGEVARSIGTTRILKASESLLPPNFKFFPETLGVMPKGMDRGGFIIREIPIEIRLSQTHLVPMFSFFTPQPSTGRSPIEEMIRTESMSPMELTEKKIIRPFVTLWLELAINHGIAIEAHGQNFLAEIKGNQITGKFYFRDFGGFNLDLEFRQERRLPNPELPIANNLEKDYHLASHGKAIMQSLYNYFEGGVLYGLAQEFERLGVNFTYGKIRQLLRSELHAQGKIYGINWNSKDTYHEHAFERVQEARRNTLKNIQFCSRIFATVN